MGYAIRSLQEALGTILETPKLLIGIGVTSLFGTLLYLFVSYIPLIGMFVAWTIPALTLAAVLTMAYEGLHGTAGFDDLITGLEEYAVSMLGAFFALFAVSTVASFAFVFLVVALVFAGAFSMETTADAGPDPAMLDALGIGIIALIVLAVLLWTVVWIVVQFFDAAIVVDGVGVIDAFKSSWGVVRSNPLSVIGYSLIRGTLMWIPVIIAAIVAAAASMAAPADQAFLYALLGGGSVFIVLSPLVSSLLIVYHTSYFDHASGNRSRRSY
ncbi:hypothetical protein D8Y22_03440 [Salinadaptatus halalkaliphilus]|uniref:DUF7847 domain-containing protein n=1 Tax=Salinadaptatus halalkaliphilus TaxID=2419781 RepID=A0A4S3TQ15_9EURY|nr:hypothetical protein [Salinadaptatus halalkaliphilus]THE66336.1 hypothetical protein D8Y22_03440 [Salinadaptatus halalkaliphilus]